MPKRKSKVLPSANIPSYFAIETSTSTPQPAPVMAALDHLSDSFLNHAHQKAASIIPTYFDSTHQGTVLTSLGFSIDTLSLSERNALFASLSDLLELRKSIRSVKILGQIYFGEIAISRGRPFRRDRTQPTSNGRFRLCDIDDRKHTVFIRLQIQSTNERLTEFTKNCQLLIPFGFQVLVMPPKVENKPTDSRLSLAKPTRLQQRRL